MVAPVADVVVEKVITVFSGIMLASSILIRKTSKGPRVTPYFTQGVPSNMISKVI